MSNDDQLDDRLRSMAQRSLASRASEVDTDTALHEHRGRLQTPRGPDRREGRWLAAAAAMVVVVAGVAAIAWPRGGDPGLVATETIAPSPTSSDTVSTTIEQSADTTVEQSTETTIQAPTDTASASPTLVRAGGTVVITPVGSVQRTCLDIVTLVATATDQALTVGQILDDEWIPAPSPDTPVTYPACEGTTSDESMAVHVPASVPAGDYEMCITQPGNPAGCASVTIRTATTGQTSCESDPLTPPSLVDGSPPGDPVVEASEVGRIARWGSPASPFPVTQSFGVPVDTSWIDDVIADGRMIEGGGWQATTVPVGDPPTSQIAIFLRNTSDGCVRVYNIGPGLYSDEAASLAEDWVAALATGQPIEPPGHDELAFTYYGRRFESTRFKLDEFSETGAFVSTVSDDQVAALFEQYTLAEGITVQLDGNRSGSRCTNQSLVRSGATASDAVITGLGEARSIAVTPDGTLLATRDICPPGTRWGDVDTYGELVRLDVTSRDPSVATLRTWQSDADLIVFEDESQVIAFGERTIADVSPDGRYVALREQYASDASRWELLDLSDKSATIAPPSVCESAGDIVGPPRFVSNDLVVIARLCKPLHTGDDTPSPGEGQVQLEAIDLAAEQPADRIMWNSSVSGLGVDEFTRSVDLSARQAPDGTIWAIISGNGGIETSSRTFALHDGETIDITRLGFQRFAFDPADLITEFDAVPS